MAMFQQRDLSGDAVRTAPGALAGDVRRSGELDPGGTPDEHRLLTAARTLAGRLLGEMGTRWAHTRGVAARAGVLAPAVAAEDRPLLVAAAWLHDIGCAEPVRRSGFPPLDGGWHLGEQAGDELLAGLVAHHSGARFTAGVRGPDRELAAFADPRCWSGRLADAPTTADETTGPDGRPVRPPERPGARQPSALTR